MKRPLLRPVRGTASDVELELEGAEAGNRRSCVGGERVIAAFDARQLVKDALGCCRQRQCCLRAGLAALFWNCPIAVRDFAPAHARNLGASGGGEQQEANELPPRRGEGLGGFPDRPQLIIGENAVTLALFWSASCHPAHDGALEVIIACG